ncbi:MAG: ABC transporter permease [Terriglobia bacterium]|jgi:putative ABC transport system permease protein
MISKLLFRLRALFRRKSMETSLNEEVLGHLRMAAQERIEQGESPARARTAALREFGNVGLVTETTRDMWGWAWLETLLQDLRYGLRMLGKNPGFTAVAVLTLALGIGANTAVFSLVNTILLRPLPYRNPSELVVLSETVPQMGGGLEVGMAAGEYLDYRDRNRSFVETGAYEDAGFNLTGEGNPLRINAAAVTASVFQLLGVPPRLGHVFTAEEERNGGAAVAVLSYSLWQRHYGGDAGILGRTIKLDEKPYLVVGVMPPSFHFPSDGAPLSERPDLWVPEVFAPDRLKDRLMEFGVNFIGRLKPGVNEQQALADASSVAAGFMQQLPEFYSGNIRVVPHVHKFAAYAMQKARPLMILLMAAVASVLLIACANVANLLLARGSYRTHEMAVRSAIGAVRSRLVRQCLVESLLLSLLGAGGGFALAFMLVKGVRAFGPADVPRLEEVAIEPMALVFTVVLLLLTTVLFGFVPAWRLSHVAPHDCLKEASQARGARGTERLQNFVVVGEIAATLVLLIGGGLLVRSFLRVLNVPLGFRPQGVYIVRTLFDEARYPNAIKRETVQKELIDRLAHLPGVQSVAAASHLPLSDSRQIGFRLEHAAPDDFHWAENSLVTPGYFPAMGISILRGRNFMDQQDRPNTPLVAIINETMARQYFPGQEPIGQRFHWGDRDLFTIIGIARDVRISALDADPPPMIYHSMFQLQTHTSDRTALILRTDGSALGKDLFAGLQQEIWSLDRDLPIYSFSSLDALISESLAQRRFTTALTLSFGLIALALALIGLFGVMSYLVAQQQRELAIRMALGANETGLWWMVMKRGAALAILGCGVGLPLLPLIGRLIRATLFETSVYDPLTLLLVPLLLLAVALVASYLPARHATKVDPMAALRYE